MRMHLKEWTDSICHHVMTCRKVRQEDFSKGGEAFVVGNGFLASHCTHEMGAMVEQTSSSDSG